MRKFSVIILLYNAQWKPLRMTLNSVLGQTGVELEIILADDASRNDCLKQTEEYLEQKGFSDYKVMHHEENVGTVCNIYDALELATGQYVKAIGAGDLLFEADTLCKVAAFMDREKPAMCFGKMQAYYMEDGDMKKGLLTCPFDVEAFEINDLDRIQKNIIQNHGWIVGASMFYDTKKFLAYLKQIRGVVRYCEDWLQIVLLLNREKISYFPEGIEYYESDSGISTNPGNGNSERIRNDHIRFWNWLSEEYGEHKLIRKGYTYHRCEIIQNGILRKIKVIMRSPRYLLMLFRTLKQKEKYRLSVEGDFEKWRGH